MSGDDELIDDDLVEDLGKAYEEISAYFDELEGESARAAAVLAVAALEDQLELLIHSKFPGASQKVWKQIAGPGLTPLGSFKTRNLVAHAFGFYGPQTRATLETLAAIRNKFAHETSVRQFDHELVVREFQKLANNPFSPFAWPVEMTTQQMRETFLEIAYRLEQALLDARKFALSAQLKLGDVEPTSLP